MEGAHAASCPTAGPQEVSSEHTLSTTLKTHLSLDAQGLGIVLIQNGPYLQIVNLIDRGPAARNGRLKPGDIMIKIGHANVLGCTLREVRQMLQNIPIGTGLQIMVYRDLVDIPQEWENVVHLLPEIKSPKTPQGTSIIKEKEDGWSSSDEDEDDDINLETNAGYCMLAKSFWYDSSTELPPISKSWHALKKNIRVLTVGLDIGCDVMIHRSFKTGLKFHLKVSSHSESALSSHSDISQSSNRTFSPFWSMVDDVTSLSSSSSTSSGSDAFWLEECAVPLKDNTPSSTDNGID